MSANHDASSETTTSPSAPRLLGDREMTEVLVPIDANFQHERGLTLAGRYAAKWGVPVRLLHIRAPDATTSIAGLESAVDGLRGVHPGILVDGQEVVAADVAAGIEEVRSDGSLLLLASDRVSQWAEVGSVAEGVLDARSDQVIMLCGPGSTDPPIDTSVVVPLDGSPRAEVAIEPAIGVAEAAGVRLWLTTAVPPATVEKVADLRAKGEHASESGYLGRVSDELEARGVNVGWEVVHHGDPVAGVVGLTRNLGASLIVASTHGDTGVAKRLFGSTTLGMVERGPVPVMVVKADLPPTKELRTGQRPPQ